jgi:predicted RNA-binding Zn-ribbon protein involved in translation (DUF1610 family)
MIGEGHQWGINLDSVRCPKCGQQMPGIRVPENLHQLLWGGWSCPQCGCRMDKWGKAIEPESEGADKPA